MQEGSDDNQAIVQPKSIQVDFFEQLIRDSSNDSSPYIEDSNRIEHVADNLEFEPQIDPKSLIKQDQKEQKQQFEPQKDLNSFNKSNYDQKISHSTKNNSPLMPEIRMQNIIKQAQQQRIGGTYDYFATVVDKYSYHLLSRKIILANITSMIDRNKIIKAHPVILLKEYLKNYVSLCVEFHEKSAKFVLPVRQENDSRIINLSVQLKPGFDKLLNLRVKTGSELARLEIYMKGIITKIDRTVQAYWNLVALHQEKSTAKRDIFEQKEKKFHKRVERIAKIYGKARIGEQISEDLFQEMLKFIRDERQLRFSIHDWGMEILNLRKSIMEADRIFFGEFQSILSEFKNFNNTIYQIKKKPFNFLDNLKQNIQENYYFQKLCTPLDADYIFNVYKCIQNSTISQLQEKDYENYLNQQYFGEVLGDQTNFLIGIIVKNFALKNEQQQLVKTISGNLVKYNKKTMQVKYKMKANNTSAELQGRGCVILKQIVKGIIFDSDHIETIYFMDDNRSEELIFFIGEEQ